MPETQSPDDEQQAEAPVLTREQIEQGLATANLTPEEENVIRLKHGLGLNPDDRLTFRPAGMEGMPEEKKEEVAVRLALMEKAILDTLEEKGGSAS